MNRAALAASLVVATGCGEPGARSFVRTDAPDQAASIGELADLDVGTDARIHRMIADLVGQASR